MKNNRLFLITAILAAFFLSLTSNAGYAQDKKEEKKVIKVQLQTDEDGTVTLDTTIVIEGDFDGDWKDMITDEDLKKKIEDIEIQLESDEDGNVMVMSSGSKGQKYVYVTTTEDSDGEVNVEVKQVAEDIEIEEIVGDSTKTYIIKHISTDGGDDDVMIWHSDGDEDVKVFDKGHNIAIAKKMDMVVEVEDGDSVLTYTIEIDGEDAGEKKMMVWTSDDKDAGDKEVFVHKMKGGKAVIFESKVKVSEIGETEKNMLQEAGVKMGKESLKIDEISITSLAGGNIKVSFPTSGLNDLSVSLLNEKGATIFMEELKMIKGKYIREMELPAKGGGTYFLHIASGKRSVTRKINLE